MPERARSLRATHFLAESWEPRAAIGPVSGAKSADDAAQSLHDTAIVNGQVRIGISKAFKLIPVIGTIAAEQEASRHRCQGCDYLWRLMSDQGPPAGRPGQQHLSGAQGSGPMT